MAPGTDFAAVREARLDVLGDLIAGHLDTAAIGRLIREGPPPGLPVVPPGGRGGGGTGSNRGSQKRESGTDGSRS